MKEIIILVGISGSGKSTWTTNFIKENDNYLRINRDYIRKTLVGNLNGYYQRKDLNDIERFINKIEEDMFDSIIYNHKNLIIDNTNLKPSYINKWITRIDYNNGSKLEEDEHNIKFKLFDISLEEARGRVWYREDLFNVTHEDISFNNYKGLDYINKQYQDYQNIKTWLLTNYKDKII